MALLALNLARAHRPSTEPHFRPAFLFREPDASESPHEVGLKFHLNDWDLDLLAIQTAPQTRRNVRNIFDSLPQQPHKLC